MTLRRTLMVGVALLIPLAGCKREPRGPGPSFGAGVPAIQASPDATEGHDAQKAPGIETSFAPVVDRVAGAVVNISSTRTLHPEQGEEPGIFNDPLFREFFGRGGARPPREMREQALGSGVIISRDGYVLTNAHMVQGASEVRVSLQDKRELKATIVGQDPKTDLALLRIPGNGFPYLELGDSTKVRVGDVVLAVGDPLGLGQTVTQGIISAKGRGNVGIVDYEDFIQTDAAINPGNSGGALVNLNGQLIGINTAIATTGGGRGNQGIGFAVPANLAREVIRQIEEHGRVIRGYLGVGVQDVTSAMAAALGLKNQGGALIGDVTDNSPASRAGLARGDVVTAIDGKPVTDSRSLRMQIAESAPGTKVTLKVLRGGQEREITATLGDVPQEQPKGQNPAQSATGKLGIQLAPLTPDLARRLDLPENASGVVVAGVEPGSRGAEAGLRPGDVIQEVDRAKVHSPEDVRKALEKNGKAAHLLLVMHDGMTHYIAISPEGE